MHERCAHGAAAEVGGARGVGVLCGCGGVASRPWAGVVCVSFYQSFVVYVHVHWVGGFRGEGKGGRGNSSRPCKVAHQSCVLVCLCVCGQGTEMRGREIRLTGRKRNRHL